MKETIFSSLMDFTNASGEKIKRAQNHFLKKRFPALNLSWKLYESISSNERSYEQWSRKIPLYPTNNFLTENYSPKIYVLKIAPMKNNLKNYSLQTFCWGKRSPYFFPWTLTLSIDPIGSNFVGKKWWNFRLMKNIFSDNLFFKQNNFFAD